jgi:hypothetical protein
LLSIIENRGDDLNSDGLNFDLDVEVSLLLYFNYDLLYLCHSYICIRTVIITMLSLRNNLS